MSKQPVRAFPYPRPEPLAIAILTPFEGKDWALDFWLAALDEIRHFPVERVDLIWLDNSGDEAFGARLRAAAEERGAKVIEHSHRLATKNETVAALWRLLRREVASDVKYVVCLEDDVLPPEDGLIRLWNLLRTRPEPLRAASGAVPYAYPEGGCETLFWQIVTRRVYPEGDACNDPAVTIASAGRRGLEEQEIDACGFGFLLVEREALDTVSLAAHGPSGLCYDQNFGHELRKLGWKLVGDWGCTCEHLQLIAGEVRHTRVPARLLSYIILGYGAPVDATLESCLAQDYPAVEVILVDDWEGEEPPDDLKAFTARGVKLVRHPHPGQETGKAYRAGFEASRGEYISFGNADYRFSPRHAPETIATLNQEPHLGFVWLPNLEVVNGKPMYLWANQWDPWRLVLPDGTISLDAAENMVGAQGPYRRSAICQAGGLASDEFALIRLLPALFSEGWQGRLVIGVPNQWQCSTPGMTGAACLDPESARRLTGEYPRLRTRLKWESQRNRLRAEGKPPWPPWVCFLNRPGPGQPHPDNPEWANWNGGDMVVQENLREELWQAGIIADHRWQEMNLRSYDLAHIMHIGLQCTRDFAELVKGQGLPYIVSTIYHPGILATEAVRLVAQGARAVICASEGEREYLTPELEGLQDRVRVIPHGVERAFLGAETAEPYQAPPYLLCVGRLQREKGQDKALAAATRLGLNLILVGEALAEQPDFAAQVLADPRVTHFARVPVKELIALYRGAACVVVPSGWESFSLVGLEAMHLGARLVMTEMTLAKEEFRGYAEFCDPLSEESVRAAVERALAGDPPARRPALLWCDVADKLVRVYQEALT